MAIVQCVIGTFIAVCISGAVAVDTRYELPDYTDHPCSRQCTDNEQPSICKYHWVIENYYVLSRACFDCPFNQSHCYLPHCVPANGMSRAIKTANRKLPGPAIEVCEGDVIEVIVDNRMFTAEGTTIHWHGILQQGTQHMDGVSQVTQCAIPAHTKFTYRFKANNPGTHFWHAHAGLQRNDGLFGPLIVHRPPSLEPHYHLYDFDLHEHVIIVTDWFHEMVINPFLGFYYSNGDVPRQILINGQGSFKEFKDAANSLFFTPRASFTVQPGRKFRFRVINASILSCPIQISVDNHRLTMIASDGNSFEPFVVDSFISFPGERFDFILHADKTEILRNYWIRTVGLAGCNGKAITQTAILKYDGSPDVLPPESEAWRGDNGNGVELNLWNLKGDESHVEISRMQSMEPDDDTLTSEPDKKIYLSMDMYLVNNPSFHNPDYYPLEAFNRSRKIFTPQINHISNLLPSSPLLSQFDDVSETAFCNAETVKGHCDHEFCSCVHRYQVSLGDLVELVMIDEAKLIISSHPMHLHGHRFRVVGLDKIGKSTSIEEVKAMDAKGELNRTTTRAPIKDTVIVPNGGYTIIRFRADNPGIWFFHCHDEFHNEIGMGLFFQVGTRKQWPKNPDNFPTCGDWNLAD